MTNILNNLVFGSIVSDVVTAVGDWITACIEWVLSVITGMIPIFYDSTAAEGSKLTVIGVLALFGLAVGLVRLGMNFVRGFFVK